MMPQQGWQCPLCGRVYSPLTPMCYYCNQTGEQVVKKTPKCTCGTSVPCPAHPTIPCGRSWEKPI